VHTEASSSFIEEFLDALTVVNHKDKELGNVDTSTSGAEYSKDHAWIVKTLVRGANFHDCVLEELNSSFSANE